MGHRKGLKVVLDTNVLLMISEGIDVFSAIEDAVLCKCEFIVPKHVVKELQRLSESESVRIRKAAALALRMINEKGVRIVEVDAVDADEAVLVAALRERAAVATNDKDLRRRARALGLTEIYYREARRSFEASGTAI